MPLVVPGLQSKDGNSTDDWMSKLMGKKLGDSHDETVRTAVTHEPLAADLSALHGHFSRIEHSPFPFFFSLTYLTRITQTFAKSDLPSEHRVLKPDSMKTMDHKPERLNVHVGEDGTVQKVTHG